jgi:hypothetical protein
MFSHPAFPACSAKLCIILYIIIGEIKVVESFQPLLRDWQSHLWGPLSFRESSPAPNIAHHDAIMCQCLWPQATIGIDSKHSSLYTWGVLYSCSEKFLHFHFRRVTHRKPVVRLSCPITIVRKLMHGDTPGLATMNSRAVVLYHVKHVHSTEYVKFEKSGNDTNKSTHSHY